ncbi:aspartate dehydrogenase [Pseudomonas aeruginosa]
MLNIVMIGCGAIGAGVLELLENDPQLRVDAVIVPRDSETQVRHRLASLRRPPRVLSALPAGERPDLLVECAGHRAIEQHVLPALAQGIPCLVVSVGALSEPGLVERLEAAAQAGGSRIELLPGAIGAIDALSAARVGGLESVRYTGRKPASAWLGTPGETVCDLQRLETARVIFDGSAREAALLYPKNANVAATLSLAGLGLDRTQVRLIADPESCENVHQVEASGAFGGFELTLRGKPLAANPKTSALTVYSVVRALGNHAHAISI